MKFRYMPPMPGVSRKYIAGRVYEMDTADDPYLLPIEALAALTTVVSGDTPVVAVTTVEAQILPSNKVGRKRRVVPNQPKKVMVSNGA